MPGLTYNTALTILAISVVASNSILALWVALGRRHWFWRVAAMEGVIALLLMIHAPGLAWFVIGHAVFAVLPIGAIRLISAARRWMKSRSVAGTRPPHWQFTLWDILVATTAVGIAAAELTRILPMKSGRTYELGALIGLATLCLALGTIGQRWLKARFVVALIILGAYAGKLDANLARKWAFYPLTEEVADDPKETFLFRVIGPGEFIALAWLLLANYGGIVATAARASKSASTAASDQSPTPENFIAQAKDFSGGSCGPAPDTSRRSIARVTAVIISVAVAAPVFFTWLLLPPVPELQRPEREERLAYLKLFEAIGRLNWTAIPAQDWEGASETALSAFEMQNRDVIAEITALAGQRCWATLDDQDWRSVPSFDVDERRSNALAAYYALAELASINGHPWERQQTLLSSLRFIESTSRGGLIDFFNGAGRWNSINQMRFEIDELTIEQCRELSRSLVELDAHREKTSEIVERDLFWFTSGWQQRTYVLVRRLTNSISEEQKQFEDESNAVVARTRLLICELAIGAFHKEHGRNPTSLEELSPDDLPTLQIDPFSDRPLVYRQTEDGYELYSVGPNRVDDGGKRVSWSGMPHGDLFLDLPDDP